DDISSGMMQRHRPDGVSRKRNGLMGAASTDNGPGPLAFAMISQSRHERRAHGAGREARPVSAADQRMLTLRGRGHYNDRDVMEVAQLALVGLAHLGV
ncbi:MAG: hypothetical protein WCC42_02485, partial [Pseudolabrys sp.]